MSLVFGVITVACYLFAARRVATPFDLPLEGFRLAAACTPLTFWFVTGFMEDTFLALPFLLLQVGLLVSWLDHGPRATRRLLAAGVFSGPSISMHQMFLVTAFMTCVFLVVRPGATLIRRLVHAAIFAVLSAVPTVLVWLVVLASGLQLVPGDQTGGYDGQMLVPFQLTPTTSLALFTFFSHAHLIEWSNIVVMNAPALVFALPVLTFAARYRALQI